ncbi:uncharacterized protein LOC125421183 [Ziziphus jujuba]|uniref:Uncharacterized protein LOC125421183 n=1 Tax=Ziziphus jujuba TaxID=326968 RepID=A0ABM3ZUV7_ZIZJJ|nr:uncharacterized protein LOC125421183 [Ziziphus jujuba]
MEHVAFEPAPIMGSFFFVFLFFFVFFFSSAFFFNGIFFFILELLLPQMPPPVTTWTIIFSTIDYCSKRKRPSIQISAISYRNSLILLSMKSNAIPIWSLLLCRLALQCLSLEGLGEFIHRHGDEEGRTDHCRPSKNVTVGNSMKLTVSFYSNISYV